MVPLSVDLFVKTRPLVVKLYKLGYVLASYSVRTLTTLIGGLQCGFPLQGMIYTVYTLCDTNEILGESLAHFST